MCILGKFALFGCFTLWTPGFHLCFFFLFFFFAFTLTFAADVDVGVDFLSIVVVVDDEDLFGF